MKKDGIQTRNRKLAAKAKKKRMHDFFKPLDPRFSAYSGMHGSSASYLTSPMSQYYGQMGQMSSFMSNTMPMGSPMTHLTGLASLGGGSGHADPLGSDLHAGHHQQQLQHHQHHEQNFTNGSEENSTNPSLVGASA